mmetsp:Transcript_14030/g.27884  ORF Transcript_14030/g.27884 Transcript_14030/m.27884 type:complete len:125 (-) Transcript_14030:121-495(-)
MELQYYRLIGTKEEETTPLSIHEVVGFFENRKELTRMLGKSEAQFNGERLLAQRKIFEYSKKFGYLDKKKIKEMKETTEQFLIKKKFINSEKFQVQLIFCKIIDLLPNNVSKKFLKNFPIKKKK